MEIIALEGYRIIGTGISTYNKWSSNVLILLMYLICAISLAISGLFSKYDCVHIFEYECVFPLSPRFECVSCSFEMESSAFYIGCNH